MATPHQRRFLHFSWNAARYALGPIGGVLLPWLVIRRTSPETWGHVVPFVITVQVLTQVGQWGSREFLLRAFAKTPVLAPSLTWSSLLTRACFMVPLATIAALFTDLDGVAVILCSLLLFIYNSLEALIIWNKRFLLLFIADVCGLAAQVGLLLVVPDIGSGEVLYAFVLQAFVRVAVIMTPILKTVAEQGYQLVDRIVLRQHIVDAFPFFLIAFSGMLGSRMDLYTMNAVMDRQEVGTYQVVAGLFVQFQALAGLISVPFTRELYRLHAGSVHRANARLARMGAFLLLPFLATALVVFVYLFHFELHWSVYPAGALLIWPAYAYVPRITLLYKDHGERNMVLANFGAAGLSLLLTLTLVPLLSLTGALLAAAAGQWLVLLVVLRSTRDPAHALPGM